MAETMATAGFDPELVAEVAPKLAAGAGPRGAFFDDLNTMAEVVKAMFGMLTVPEYQDEVLSGPLTPDPESPDPGWRIHRHCPAWDRFGNRDPARREHSCVIGMGLSGEMIDPRIRCRPASLPPHREPRDHACKWEYWLEGG